MSIPPPNAHNPAHHSIEEDANTYYTSLGTFNHLQWMLQSMSTGEAIASHLCHPREGLPSLMLGDHQTIVLLWHCLTVTPFGSRLGWGGAGTSIPLLWQTPAHKGAPASDTMRSQLQCRMHECPCWSFTSYEGTSVTI